MTTRKAIYAAVVISLPFLSGCPLLFGLGLSAGASEAELRIAQEPCGDSACRRGAWRVMAARTDTIDPFWPTTTTSPVPFDVASGDEIISVSANRTDGRLALIDRHGGLLVSPAARAGQSKLSTQVAQVPDAALGIAWSNAGDRLAVVVRDTNGAHRVALLDESFDVVAEWPVDLADIGPPPLPQRWRFLVSWSADDARIAITHDPGRGATYPAGVIVTANDGETIELPVYRGFFVGADKLVADLPNEQGTIVYQVSDDAAIPVDSIPASHGVLASDPVTGVFASIESPFQTLGIDPIALRTRSGGGDIVSDLLSISPGVDLTIVIVPAE